MISRIAISHALVQMMRATDADKIREWFDVIRSNARSWAPEQVMLVLSVVCDVSVHSVDHLMALRRWIEYEGSDPREIAHDEDRDRATFDPRRNVMVVRGHPNHIACLRDTRPAGARVSVARGRRDLMLMWWDPMTQ